MMIQSSEFCPQCDQRLLVVLDVCKNEHEKPICWNIAGYELPHTKARDVYLDRDGVLCVTGGSVRYSCLICGLVI